MGRSLNSRIAAFEEAAAQCVDPEVLANKISAKSDRKKYDFATGLSRDLASTRLALKQCCSVCQAEPVGDSVKESSQSLQLACAFQMLFEHTEGKIANLNRILQNLRDQREISFQPECFFRGVHDSERIVLLDKFWREEYAVTSNNVFRPENSNRTLCVERKQRRGRSYEEEILQTIGRNHRCLICGDTVSDRQRLRVRTHAYHITCLNCAVCGAKLRQRLDFLTFDGSICCGTSCVQRYDAAHLCQKRN